MGTLASGRTAREWRPLWQNDLWSSLNFRSLPIPEKGIYNLIWSLCRDGKYAGCLCFPNGIPMKIEELISAMCPQERDRTDRIRQHIREIIRTGMLYLQNMDTKVIAKPKNPINEKWIKGEIDTPWVLVVRKYAKKSSQALEPEIEESGREIVSEPPETVQKAASEQPEGGQKVTSEPPEGEQKADRRRADVGQTSTRRQPDGSTGITTKGLTTSPHPDSPAPSKNNNNKEVKKYRTEEEVTKEPVPSESLSLLLSEKLPLPKVQWMVRKFTPEHIKAVVKYCTSRAKNSTPTGMITRALEENWNV